MRQAGICDADQELFRLGRDECDRKAAYNNKRR